MSPRPGATDAGRTNVYVSCEMAPRNEGPRRIPATTSPITGGWPMKRNSLPSKRPVMTTPARASRRCQNRSTFASIPDHSRSGQGRDGRLLEDSDVPISLSLNGCGHPGPDSAGRPRMKWQGRTGSTNIEDRRGAGGMRMGLPLGGGIGGIVLLLLYSALTGTNPIDIVNSGAPTEETAPTGAPANDAQAQFISVVLKSTEDVWGQLFNERRASYEPPVLVLFSDATQSACGLGQSAMGPFYCPRDRKVYLDLSFFQELAERFGAPGEFARAYVVAHEVGHHVQTLTGLSDRVSAAREQGDRAGSNALSVRQELQADCYAGVW